MKQKKRRIISGVLAILMIICLIPMPVYGEESVGAENNTVYQFDASTLTSIGEDKAVIPEGTSYTDGYFKTVGTVTQRTDSKTGNVKSLEIGKALSGGIEFTVIGTATVTVEVSSTGGNNTSAVGLLNTVDKSIIENKEKIATVVGTGKTSMTYENLTAGTYQVVSPEDANNARGAIVYTITVDEYINGTRPDRKAWDLVEAPAITSILQDGDAINITFTMDIGYDGADSVEVIMYNNENTTVDTISYAVSGTEGNVSFTPSSSGDYTFSIVGKRADNEDKLGNTESISYVLPLKKPAIASATSKGNGMISVVWGDVSEATSYELYCNDTLVATTTDTSYTVKDLIINGTYSFYVVAVREDKDKSVASDVVEAVATQEEQIVWGFTRYGSSTNDANNGYIGNANNGSVTVYSESGKGKIVPNSTDGIAFYYTPIPTEKNFTLKAKVHVDNWKLSNGQEGFGLLVTDRLGENGNTNPVWNNQYMALATKIEYYWNSDTKAVDTSGTKYSMKCGLGVIAKTGVTLENLDKLNANDTDTVKNEFSTVTSTLETTVGQMNLQAGTYNVIGNAEVAVDNTIAEYTDFILEIQKNNTGYFITYYDEEGNIIATQKNYDPDALSHLDSDYVYAGFFASRNARVTFTDIELTTILASEDVPKEETPITYVTPTLNITSSNVANTENYTLQMDANVDGTAVVTLNGDALTEVLVEANKRVNVPILLTSTTKNQIDVVFTPDPNYVPGEYMELANTDKVSKSLTVTRNLAFSDMVNLYVSPTGTSVGTGTKEHPIDIYTAVKYAQPGQTIIVMEGTYLLSNTVKVDRGIDGTEDNYIRMIADPEASSRPVFDFQGLCAGMIFAGDYWYFNGFDCTNSQNGQKGIQVSGNYNVVDNVHTYHNGNTGLQISRLNSLDNFEDWPSYNLILNCTSYGNADAGYEDADGFAAKLTVGDGNVFDGCVAYNNADDGWDLFAKVETGSIGSVTIKNSVAYGNGYLEDGTDAGNGNGFKMGGDSLSGYHKLINCYAFFNKAKGIDSNSCPDIQVENCISYNNESYNVALYTNNAANTDFSANGIISFKDSSIKSGLSIKEQINPRGTQDTTKYSGNSNYYWNGTTSVNGNGEQVTSNWFKSLTFTGISRNTDGTINLNGFLELTDVAAQNTGAIPVGTASYDITIQKETAIFPQAGNPIGSTLVTTNEKTVIETSQKNNYIPKSVFSEILLNNRTFIVNVTDEDGSVFVQYTIEDGKLNQLPDSHFLLNVANNKQDETIVAIAKKMLGISEKGIEVFDFEHSGQLNGQITVKVSSSKHAVGTTLKLYHYNEDTNTLEDMNQTVVIDSDGMATFTATHFSSYVLVNMNSKEEVVGDEDKNDQNVGDTITDDENKDDTTTDKGNQNTDVDNSDNNHSESTQTGDYVPMIGLVSAMVLSFMVLIVLQKKNRNIK